MFQSVDIDGERFRYRVVRGGIRRVRMKFLMKNTFEIAAPKIFAKIFLSLFLKTHKNWILREAKKFITYTDKNLIEESVEHFQKHKSAALKLCQKRVAFWAKKYGFSYNDIRVKRLQSKWGSCSSKRNLNFNYKVLFLPREAAESLFIHEICHLKEMNHSHRFWNLVRKYDPNTPS